jgi:quercetin dioxygenase-like cupin family protein
VLGRAIENPHTGELILIRKSAEQTNGRLLEFDLYLPPGGHVPGRHAHPEQAERFTIIDGQLRFRVGRRTMLVSAGETLEVPAGTAHWFGNAVPRVSHARVEVRPALRMEDLLAEAAALDGSRKGLARLAAFLLEFERELAVPYVPARLVRAVLTPLARFAAKA